MSRCECRSLRRITSGTGLDAHDYARGHLRVLVADVEQWESLYGCPETGRLWKLYFEQPERYGARWPQLVQVSPEEAASEFGWSPAPDERLSAIRAAPRPGQPRDQGSRTCKCRKLRRVIGGPDEYAYGHLRVLAYNRELWETLLGCPETGRLWKEYRVFPEYHGGGWPVLVQVTPEEAAREFGWAPAPDERLLSIRAAPDSRPGIGLGVLGLG